MFQQRGNRPSRGRRTSLPATRRLASVEKLEDRKLLAVLVVSNVNDAGPGSLREAVVQANASLEKDEIAFAIPGVVPKISLASPLPFISNPVIIDASTQPGFVDRPVVQLDGSSLTDEASSAFVLQAGDSTVRGFALTNFATAMFVTGPGGNVIAGNYLGVSPSAAEDGGNRVTGVYIVDSPNNLVGGPSPLARNVISGNGQYGIRINGALSQNNRIQGNYIGTNAAGTAAVPNAIDGILLSDGSRQTVIGTDGDGTTDVLEGNLISGNQGAGIELYDSSQNAIAGNLVGTNPSGSTALPNGRFGVAVVGQSRGNRIGTNGDGISDSAERNLISGNADSGIAIFAGSSNVIAGNFIGTGLSGTTSLKNGSDGVLLTGDAEQNRIGTNGDGIADSAEGNLISGNGTNGITIWHAHRNTVAGNLIGLSATGSVALPNEHSGLWIANGATQNLVGTDDDGVNDMAERNVISGNFREGVAIQQSSSNRVAGNYIGTNRDGTAPIGNSNGIWMSAASSNVIGTDAQSPAGSSAGNVIAGSRNNGIFIFGSGATANQIGGNWIGLGAAGTQAFPNTLSGITITASASANLIGGERPEQRNTISGNSQYGISLTDQAHGTTILGNRIGLEADGVTARGNALGGIFINAAYDNAIGGETADAANVIAYNGARGIVVTSQTALNNRIERNSIYGHSLVGIDLGSDGATPNDVLDSDRGPNALQNYPDIQFVAAASDRTQVAGKLFTEAGTQYLLRFYAKHGDGNLIDDMEYLGATELVAGAAGNRDWLVEFPLGVSADRTVIATARSSSSGTSEFSPPQDIFALLPVAIQATQVTEGAAPLQASVSRGEIPLDRNLVVSLVSSDPQRASVPAQIQIPAGQASSSFTINIIDDVAYEAWETLVISAHLPGEAAGAASLAIIDDESAWYNYASPMDVNGDGAISPLDALVVINALNHFGSVPVSSLPQPTDGSKLYVDTNLDGFLSPIDALLVINYLNVAAAGSTGEGEGANRNSSSTLDAASVDQVFFEVETKLRRTWS